MSLRIRRGTEADRTSKVFDLGELIWTTNGQKLYVGDGLTTGGIDIAAQLAGTGLHYNTSTGKLDTVLSGLTTDSIPQGTNNLYFSTQLAQTAVAAALTAGNSYNSHIQFTYDDVNDRITAAVTLDGIGLTAISQDTAPSLGGNLSLNSHNITGTGNITNTGSIASHATGDSTTLTILGSTITPSASSSIIMNSSAYESVVLNGITDGALSNNPWMNIKSSRGTLLSPATTAAGDYLGGISLQGRVPSGLNKFAAGITAKWEDSANLASNSNSELQFIVSHNNSLVISKISSTGTFTTPAVSVGDGTSTTPSIGFTTDGSQDSGWFHPGDGIICTSINGIEKVRVDGGGVRVDGFMKVKQYSGVLPTPAEAGMIVLDGAIFKGYDGSNWVNLN